MKPAHTFRMAPGALLLAFGSVCGPAAAQTIYGPGGLLLNPTADTPAKGHLTPAVLVLPEKRQDGPGHVTWASYTLDYGATDKLEVGLSHLKVSPGTPAQFSKGSTGLYAKYRVLSDRPGKPFAVAVGAGFLGGGDADARSAFGAVRYTPQMAGLQNKLHLHAGGIYVDELDSVKRHRTVPYAGADYALTKDWSLFGEARASMPIVNGNADGTHPMRAVGAVYHTKDLKVVLAYATNGWNNSGPRFAIGVGYSLGGGR